MVMKRKNPEQEFKLALIERQYKDAGIHLGLAAIGDAMMQIYHACREGRMSPSEQKERLKILAGFHKELEAELKLRKQALRERQRALREAKRPKTVIVVGGKRYIYRGRLGS